MASTSDSRMVERFDGTNVRMQMFLLEKDLLKLVDGTEVRPITTTNQPSWDARDGRASLQILSLSKLKTSKEAWDALVDVYETNMITTKMYLQKTFYSMKMSEEESIVDHINNFCSLVEQLATAGVAISDGDSAIALLETLPESYEGLVVSLRTKTTLSLQTVIGVLLQEEVNLKNVCWKNNVRKTDAFYTSKKKFEKQFQKKVYPSKVTENKQTTSSKKGKRFFCKKPGHHINECKKRLFSEQNEEKQANSVINTKLFTVVSQLKILQVICGIFTQGQRNI